jgi:hypothetical protein
MSNAVMNMMVPFPMHIDWKHLLSLIWHADRHSLKSMEQFGMVSKDGLVGFTLDDTLLD